jgi:hypothetical protein
MHTDECTGGWERWLPAISTRKRSFREVNTDFGYIHRRKESKSDQRAGCQPARSTPWQLKDWYNISQNREKEDGNKGVKLGLCLNDVAKLAGNKRREQSRLIISYHTTLAAFSYFPHWQYFLSQTCHLMHLFSALSNSLILSVTVIAWKNSIKCTKESYHDYM